MPLDMVPLWVPPRPAIVRAAPDDLRLLGKLKREACRAAFPLMPIPVVGGVVPLTSVSVRTTATSTGSTIAIPGDVVAGEVLALWDVGIGTTGNIPTDVVPGSPAFTRITPNTLGVSGGTGAPRGVASYRIAQAGDAGQTLTGMNGNSSNNKMLYVLAPNAGAVISAVAISGTINSDPNTGNPASQANNASSGTPPLAVFGCYGSTGAISPRTFSTTADQELTSSNNAYFNIKIYNTSPANTNVDMDDEGTNVLASFYLQFS